MRNLLLEAIDLPVEYDPDSRAGALMTLILHEIRQLPVVPLSLPFPTHGPLAAYCRRFLRHPTPHETIDAWSDAVGMSRRAFTRLFRHETGLSFGTWRQQACLFAALPRLVAGEPVTTIAIDLGYDNPAAFTAMFKRIWVRRRATISGRQARGNSEIGVVSTPSGDSGGKCSLGMNPRPGRHRRWKARAFPLISGLCGVLLGHFDVDLKC